MGISHVQFQEMLARTQRNQKRQPPELPSEAVQREMDLHEDIMKYCDGKWPRWKYIRARSDKRSTIATGAQDLTIFKPDGKVLCVECKSKTGKTSEDQIIWRKEMEMLGHTVHEVRSMPEFLAVLMLNQ